MMQVLKNIITKHKSLPLGTLMAFVMIGNIVSCNGCRNNQEDHTGTLVITSNKNNLKGKKDCEFEMTVKGAEADKLGAISNFKMKVSIKQTGGTAGESEIKFKQTNADGTPKEVSIKDNETAEAKELGYFFNLDGKTSLSDSEREALKNKFTFHPGKDVTKLVAISELVDQNGATVGAPCIVTWESETPGTYTLAVDKTDIQDGATKITVTVAIAGGAAVKKEDLDQLSLKITRDAGSHATIQDATATIGKPAEFIYAFRTGAHELQIAGDKKSATKELTIVPGKDKGAKFELMLLDKEGKEIATAKETVRWKDGVEIEVSKLDYNVASQQVEYIIKNKGLAPTVDVKLSWEGEKGEKVIINNQREGNVELELEGANKTVQGVLPVKWDNDTHATFKFTVKHKGEAVYNQGLTFAKRAPQVTIALKNSTKTKFTGEGEKQVTFVVTAGTKELSKKDLQSTKLDYTAAHGRLLHTGKDAKDPTISLYTLLGMGQLLPGASKEVTLTIDNDKKSAVSFTDIKIKGSDKEDEDANKVKHVAWVGEIKVKVAPNGVDTKQLKGDAGKTVPLKFTNASGFDLEQADLQKINIDLTRLALGAFVNYGSNKIEGGTTTLWDLLGANLADGQTVNKDLTLETGRKRTVVFTLALGGENKEITNNQVAIKWKGEIKVKIEGYDFDKRKPVDLTNLKGAVGKRIPIGFINQSKFDLNKEDLEKVTIQLADLTGGASVSYDNGTNSERIESEKTTLYDLLGGDLNADGEYSYGYTYLILVPDQNQLVDFTLTLAGENKAVDKQVAVHWEAVGEIKVSVKGYNPKSGESVDLTQLSGEAGKIVPLRFINKSGFDLGQEELEKVKIEFIGLKQEASVAYGFFYNNIESGKTTLWDIINSNLSVGEPYVSKLSIVDGRDTGEVNFTFKLAGENKQTTHNQVGVVWKKGVDKPEVEIMDADVPIFIQGATKTFELKFCNNGTKELDAAALDNIKVKIAGKDKNANITFKDVKTGQNKQLVSGTTTLKELLGEKITLGAYGDVPVEFTLDPGTAANMNFTLCLTGSGSANIERAVSWEKTVRVAFMEPVDGAIILNNFPTFVILNNQGAHVKFSDIQVQLLTEQGVKFDLENVKGVADQAKITLAAILGAGPNEFFIAGTDVFFEIKHIDEGSKNQADVVLVLLHDGQEFARNKLQWKKQQLVSIDVPTEVKGNTPFELKLRNTSGVILNNEILKQIQIQVAGGDPRIPTEKDKDKLVISYSVTDTKLGDIHDKSLDDLLTENENLIINQLGMLDINEEAVIGLKVWKGKDNPKNQANFIISLVNAGTTQQKEIDWKTN